LVLGWAARSVCRVVRSTAAARRRHRRWRSRDTSDILDMPADEGLPQDTRGVMDFKIKVWVSDELVEEHDGGEWD
jgi:hypothetical protein